MPDNLTRDWEYIRNQWIIIDCKEKGLIKHQHVFFMEVQIFER